MPLVQVWGLKPFERASQMAATFFAISVPPARQTSGWSLSRHSWSSSSWNSSGIAAKVGLDGIEVRTDGLAALLAAGIAFDPPPERIARLAEVVGALKAFCTGEPLSIDGPNVRWNGFAGAPRPVQRPHPPLMIGGGSRRVLELAAREAQVVSLNFNNSSGILGPDGVPMHPQSM